MSRRQCGTCGQPVTDQATICWGCTGALQLDLQRIGGYQHPDGRWIPGLLDDLLTAAVGAARIPQQGGQDDGWGRTLDSQYPATCSTAGTPGNPAAMAAHHELTNALTTWARALLDDRPDLTPPTTRPVAGWLEAQAPHIRRRDWAPAMLADLDRHLAHAEALVDLPDAITVPCPWCTRRVPIDPDADLITCHCGCWGVLDWWIEQVAPPLPTEPMTLAEIPEWLRTRGYEVTPQQIRTWADRGTMPCIGDQRGHGVTRTFHAKTILEAAEQSGARRVIPTSISR